MTTTENIKFVKETSNKMFVNSFTNRRNSTRYFAMKGDKMGYLPGDEAPYSPIGGMKALKEVASILIWK